MTGFYLTGAAILAFCSPLLASTADDLIKQGDAYESKLHTSDALHSYLEAEKLEPKNADLLVRIARQYRHLMAEASSDDDKLRLGYIAINYGQRAASIAPNNSHAQLSTGISYGKLLPFLGSREQMEASKLIKMSADKAIDLDPNNDLAWHVLGRWYHGLAGVGSVKRALASLVYDGIPEGTNEDAVKCFQKAIQINPHRVIHCTELGCTYASMGDKKEARTFLNKAIKLPTTEKDDAAAKTKSRQELARLR